MWISFSAHCWGILVNYGEWRRHLFRMYGWIQSWWSKHIKPIFGRGAGLSLQTQETRNRIDVLWAWLLWNLGLAPVVNLHSLRSKTHQSDLFAFSLCRNHAIFAQKTKTSHIECAMAQENATNLTETLPEKKTNLVANFKHALFVWNREKIVVNHRREIAEEVTQLHIECPVGKKRTWLETSPSPSIVSPGPRDTHHWCVVLTFRRGFRIWSRRANPTPKAWQKAFDMFWSILLDFLFCDKKKGPGDVYLFLQTQPSGESLGMVWLLYLLFICALCSFVVVIFIFRESWHMNIKAS